MPIRFIRSALVALLLAMSAAGCSSRSGKVPVSGTVTVDGAPASLAVITFWPDENASSNQAGDRITADPSGKFTLGSDEADTGLFPGKYKVTVSRMVDKNGKPTGGAPPKKSEAQYEAKASESVDEKFLSKETTPFSVTVAKGAPLTLEVTAAKKK
ncbi:carboxypeptidase-like regulatory domain-containing protein [Fimbriiglobus ruber]|uniref:Carboxypeptidase regulatory-like domain-containing protein n=1 Tax=Fimbriiglobus ruber TaxID=1908690 RepID=A0A225E9Q6_9BACT|nr:carboxypeptidase-like regulatory domain-containing protein [Fimbriiglobus ruber]OWK46776.1 hypothetical protein FRUB_00475 [Fimbriiglobus ruber]